MLRCRFVLLTIVIALGTCSSARLLAVEYLSFDEAMQRAFGEDARVEAYKPSLTDDDKRRVIEAANGRRGRKVRRFRYFGSECRFRPHRRALPALRGFL